MELINLPRLRNQELQTVGENSIRICSAINEVTTAVDKAANSLNSFKKGMQKDTSTGISKAELDNKRDRLLYGLMLSIKAESHFPHDSTTAKTASTLINIANKYTGITRMSYNEQTAAIDNLLEEISKLGLSAEVLPFVQRWLEPISNANLAFKAGHEAFIEGNVKLSGTSAASYVAPQLAEDLQNLYTLMFAYAKIGNNQAIIDAYQELEFLINSVN